MNTRSVLLAIVLAVAPGLAALAAEGGGGGLPQLNASSFPQQLVWLAILFGTLYYLMSRTALPKVSEILEERRRRLATDLEKAQSLQDETKAVAEGYEKAMAEARTQAQKLMSDASADAKARASERQGAFQASLTEKMREAEERIAKARTEAIANVRGVAADVVTDIAVKVAGVSADVELARKMVDDALGETR